MNVKNQKKYFFNVGNTKIFPDDDFIADCGYKIGDKLILKKDILVVMGVSEEKNIFLHDIVQRKIYVFEEELFKNLFPQKNKWLWKWPFTW